MNTLRSTTITTWIRVAFVFSCIAVLASCAKRVAMTNTTLVPGAEGTVKIKNDRNGNYLVEVKVEKLAESTALSPPRTTYVVWLETSGGVRNIGRIVSNNMRGTLLTTTPHQPTRIFITAEDHGEARTPGQTVVLRTETFTVK